MGNTSLDDFLNNSESEDGSAPGEESEDESRSQNDEELADDEESRDESESQNGDEQGEEGTFEGESGAQDDEEPGDGTGSRKAETPGDDTPGVPDGSEGEERIDPPTPTSRWQSNGQDCTVCERSVTRLWSDDGRLVCADCKDWA